METTTKKVDRRLTPIVNNYNISLPPAKKTLGLLPNQFSFQNAGKYRPQFYSLSGNEVGIDKLSREQVVRLSRVLFAQFPIFNVASEQLSNWVVGDHWDFKYNKDGDFKPLVEDFINNVWYYRCSSKGSAYDFKTCLKLWSQAITKDGDMLIIFTKDKTGFPLLQYVTTERISNPKDGGVLVEVNGVNYEIWDGILFDIVTKEPKYISVTSPNSGINSQDISKNVTYVSLKDSRLLFSPQFFDKFRGLPALHAGTLYGLSLQELDQYLMETLKLESTLAMINITDNGEAPQEYSNLLESIQSQANAQTGGLGNMLGGVPGSIPSPTTHGITVQQGSSERYVKEGNDIKSFRSQRPSEEIQSYMTRIETALLSSIGYPHQLLYSPEKLSGKATFAITEMVRKTISTRQQLLKKHAKLCVAWAIVNAIELGILPETDDNVFNYVDFTMPAKFSLDFGNEHMANVEDYRLGLSSLSSIAEKLGVDSDKIMIERANESDKLLEQVDRLHEKYKDMPKEVILNLLTQRGQSSISIVSQPALNNNVDTNQ